MPESKKTLVPVRMTKSERENLHKAAKDRGTTAAGLIRRGLEAQGVKL
jgi:hypothetical protein